MNLQRMAGFGSLLAAAVAALVTGVAARSNDRGGPGTPGTRVEREDQQSGDRNDRRERTVVAPRDRRVIRLDGRGSQLGVMVSDGDAAAKPGVRIDGVDDGSAAAKAGVQEGDVVVEFDGERVRSARQLTRLVQETPPGRTVKMTVLRGSARQMLDVTPESSQAAFTWNGRDGADIRADLRGDVAREIEREIERGMRDVPRSGQPMFDFRFDGRIPGTGGRGRLGVEVESLGDQLAGYFGATGGGVLVSSVTKESPAEKAGLKAGDVITTVNGTAVRDAGELVEGLSDVKDGAEVSIGILRDKKASTVKATLESPSPARSPRPA